MGWPREANFNQSLPKMIQALDYNVSYKVVLFFCHLEIHDGTTCKLLYWHERIGCEIEIVLKKNMETVEAMKPKLYRSDHSMIHVI